MSNYPPPPPPFGGVFGGAFNTAAPFTQSTASLPGLSQYVYPSSQTSTSHATGALHAQYANKYSFNINQQETNKTSKDGANYASSSTLLDQGPNTAIPPPAFAPLRFPPRPDFQQASQQPIANPASNAQRYYPQQSQAGSFDLAKQAEVSLSPNTVSMAQATARSDLEDGELSDDNTREHQGAPSPILNSPNETSSASPGRYSHGQMSYPSVMGTMPTALVGTQYKGKTLTSRGKEKAKSILNQMSRSTTDNHQTSMAGNAPYVHNQLPEYSPQVSNGTCAGEDKRQQAKAALQPCYERGLTFVHFVREGVDSSLLEELYAEIGAKISSQETAAAEAFKKEHARNFQNDKSEAQYLPTNLQGTSTSERSEIGANGEILDTQQSTASGAIPGSPLLLSATNRLKASNTTPKHDQPKRPKVQQITNQVSSNNTSANKMIQTSAKASDKSYDRKDHIARMLAARAGKTASTANISAPTSPASASQPSTLQKSTSKASPLISSSLKSPKDVDRPERKPGPDTVAGKPKKPTQTISASPVTTLGREKPVSHSSQITIISTPATDLEAKKRAQTELARRKMEALLNRSSSKPQEEPISQLVQTPAPKPYVPPAIATSGPPPRQSPVVAISAAPQAPPTPRPSFFSPTPGRQFTLPGLFMPPAPLAAIPDSDSQGAQAQLDQPTSSTSTSQHLQTEATSKNILSSPAPAIPANKGSTEIQKSEVVAAGSSSTQIVNNPRKRQKAADFIDPPPTRVKRLFGQSGDKSVVIEVSDDEALDGSLDDVEMEVNKYQDMHALGQLRTDMSRNSQPNAPDAQLERKNSTLTHTQTSVGTMTSLTIPSYAKDSEGLKSKEMEIEMMKRRIAEVEQRRKGKQASSRAQTPNTSKAPSTPKQSRATSEIVEHSKTSLSPNKALVATGGIEEQEGNPHVSFQGNESVDQESLLAEQLAVETEQPPVYEPDQRRRSDSMQQCQQQEVEIEGIRIREASEQRSLDLDGTRKFDGHRNEEVIKKRLEDQYADKNLKETRSGDTPATAKNMQVLQAAEQADKDKGMQRRAAIEAGLPLLDAEVRKTERKLQYLQNQVLELESELQRGIEGRRNLVEELRTLSPNPSTMPGPQDPEHASNEIPALSDADSQGSHHSTNLVRGTSPVSDPETSISSPVGTTLPATATVLEPSLPGSPPASASNDDLEEDIMDISKNSDVDEGEIFEHTPQPTSRPRSVARSVDGEDAYEPPNVMDVDQAAPSIPSDLHICQQDFGGNALGLASDQLLQAGSMNETDHPTTEERIEPLPTTHHSMQAGDLDAAPIRTNVNNDRDDSDNYEPPEPVSPSEHGVSDKRRNIKDTQLTRSSSAFTNDQCPAPLMLPGIQGTAGVASPQAKQLLEGANAQIQHKRNHFAPYQSPLKQFKSYRYHRSFSADVADGFRSLTYSHDINPEEPICPFEIGGTCNDQSCPYQHFRNMNLSDNMILLQLGTVPDGLSDKEQTAYTEGLKKLIRDIRSRNVRDFDAMAADITTYRANFIGDTTKILPL